MSIWRSAWVMFLATLLLKAVPDDEDGKRLALAVSDYLARALAAADSPKAKAAAADFAKLSVRARLQQKDVG